MEMYIKSHPDDDMAFLEGLNRLTSTAVRTYDPDELFIVRVDNWFDVKWFGFAGKSKVHIDSGLPEIDSEVIPVWKSKSEVTVPPFVPNRIIEQIYFNKDNGIFIQTDKDNKYVHSMHRQRSSDNLKNKVLDFTSSGIIIWFSSRSAANGRASMMLYRINNDKVTGWYVSFKRDNEWRVDRVKNMTQTTIEKIFKTETEKNGT